MNINFFEKIDNTHYYNIPENLPTQQSTESNLPPQVELISTYGHEMYQTSPTLTESVTSVQH